MPEERRASASPTGLEFRRARPQARGLPALLPGQGQHSGGRVSLQELEVAEKRALCGIQMTPPNPQPQCPEGKTAAAESELEGPAPVPHFLSITDTGPAHTHRPSGCRTASLHGKGRVP